MRTRTKAIALGLSLIIALAIIGITWRLETIGSGSGWEFDYAIATATVNGEAYGIDPEEELSSNDVSGSGGGGWGVWALLKILSQDAYHITIDPDGLPVSDWFRNNHAGLAPNVAFQMSQAWRVNENRERIPNDTPCANAVEIGDETWNYYYYVFDVYIESQSRPFTAVNQVGAAYTTAEAGNLDCELVINVRLQEKLFGPIDGEFMDATIYEVQTNLDELLAAQVVYAIYPDISASPINSAIEIQDRTPSETQYTCTMHIPVNLQCGLTRIDLGQNYVPADVWVRYSMITTLLLKEPLEIGTQGGHLDGGLPPNYVPPWDLRVVLLVIGVGVFLLIAFFIYIRFRNRD